MLYLKTEDQQSFCCADCAAGVNYLDISDLSLAGLKIPYTNRNTEDFVLAPGEKKTIGTCHPFRFIGMATAKPIKMGFRGKYESNNYVLAYDYQFPVLVTDIDGLGQELGLELRLAPKVEDFYVPPNFNQYLISTPDTIEKVIKLQVLNGEPMGTYKFQVEMALGIILEFTVTVSDGLAVNCDRIDVLGLYSGTEYNSNNNELIMDNLKKYYTFNNVFMADATFMGTVDTIELWNDTLAPARVILISAS